MKRLLILGAAVAGFASIPAGAEVSDQVVRNSLQPYEDWTPKAPGYEPGMKVTKDNADALKDIMDPFTARYVKQGWFEIQTTPTFSLPQHPITSSRRNCTATRPR